MRVADFDFELPQDLIALRPAVPRDSARLLIVREGCPDFFEATIGDLPGYLDQGDVCVFNDTRVIRAQLFGVRPAREASPDSRIEVTLHKRLDTTHWAAFAKPGRKLNIADEIRFAPGFSASVQARRPSGEIHLRFNVGGAALDLAIAEHGVMPLPPYIAGRRPADVHDQEDYQTMFAMVDGAVAAPTAGLHFTPDLLSSLEGRGVKTASVTLHVGAGTFLPVKVDETDEHVMHAEWGSVPERTASLINEAKAAHHRVMSVGTTSLRTLEAASNPELKPWEGDTSIFITPGYRFKTVDTLLTNFHLPRSTLFMLVSAFCGLETMRAAYAHAIEQRFRFYSYGDACLLIRNRT
ncbi:MAG: tRNA preQ1(34) S-adenosylmethionine ribosyltransferase-isomerase QueA [Micropepsaceae bacterium]